MTISHRTLLQQALDALTNCLSEHGHRCNRCDSEIDEGGKLITALREAMASPEPEPVACLIRHRTCTPARLAYDKRTHWHEWGEWQVATLAHGKAVTDPARNPSEDGEWQMMLLGPIAPPAAPDHLRDVAEKVAPAAPVPLTDTETHAELWKLAVRKGLITVRSELIDPRNHGTRVSWMQGHDKACDISNDAAAHGIAASPAAPAAPVVPLTDERITKALRRAFSLGQTYWQQADSDSYTQNAKSDETRQKFETLIVETLNGITGGSK